MAETIRNWLHWLRLWHDWVIVDAHIYCLVPKRVPTNSPDINLYHGVTECLLRCHCGAVKFKEIKGKWTLEQLQGGEVSALERMYRK